MTASKKLIQASAGNVAGGDFYPYTVDYSCRFYGNDKLTWTAPSGGNRKTFTISLWAKPAMDGTSSVFFNVDGSGAGDSFGVYHQSTGGFYAFGYSAALSYYQRQQINQLYRDPSAWYHWVFAYDTTAATTADRFKIYVNGVELDQSNWTNTTTFPLNADTGWNESGRPHEIGEYADDVSSTDTHMYMAQFAVVDGQQLDASSFGEFKNGIWVPKNLSSLTWGSNGFWLDFADSSNLGNDVSGNNNDFTSSGLTSSDQMIDTPTHNNVTWLPIYQFGGSYYKSSGTLSDGNLTASVNTNQQIGIASSVLPSTGKWYWEIEVDSVASMGIGMTNTRYLNDILSNQTLHFNSGGSGNSVYIEGSIVTTYGTSWTTGDVIGVYFNADDGEISWYKNGTAMDSSPYSLSYSDGWIPYIAQLSGAGTCVGTLVTDENKFNHTPPADALSLSTANMPEPTIGPNSDIITSEVFEPILYTGNGTSQSISTLEFQPDFTWIKSRDAADNHMLFDAVRGATKYLNSNTQNAEATDAQSLSSFNSNGFSVGNNVAVNTNAEDYVAWNWKISNSGVANTDGTKNSTVYANPDAGMSIVTYVGSGASGAGTVGHGLGAIPDVVLVKHYNPGFREYDNVYYSSNVSYFKSIGRNGGLQLHSSSAAFSSTNYWGTSDPTSTVFGVGSGTYIGNNKQNYNNIPTVGADHIAYCFAEVEGFSSFGSYTGNGSADGPMIFTNFRPAFVIIKTTGQVGDWIMLDTKRDTYNVSKTRIDADLPNVEYAGEDLMDILSNGFKLRTSSASKNPSGQQVIYMAFAENPFKYANAR